MKRRHARNNKAPLAQEFGNCCDGHRFSATTITTKTKHADVRMRERRFAVSKRVRERERYG